MAGGGIKMNYIAVRGGADGKTPEFRIIDGNLYYSFDKWVSRYLLGKVKGDDGATGAKLVSQEYQGKDEEGGNIYKQTFDDGTIAYFTVPKIDELPDKSFVKTFTKKDFLQVGVSQKYVLTILQETHKLKNPYVDKVLIDQTSNEEDVSFKTNIVFAERVLSSGAVKVYITIDLSKITEYSGKVYLKGE